MPCYNKLRKSQTFAQRVQEVRKATANIGKLLADRRIQMKVGPQGAVTFVGLTDEQRADLTDACIYRQIKLNGSPAAKAALQRAEQLSGRAVDRKMVAHGVHSHDGGATWHPRG